MLISSGEKNILVDAGISSSYTKHVSPTLTKLKQIDLLCVSHIDDDHIGGVLKMMEDLVDWRVFDFHNKSGSKVKKPKSFRPPQIAQVWHNAFSEFKTKNQGEIESMLAAVANVMSASDADDDLRMGEIAFGQAQALQLSNRLKPGQLNIPLNKDFGGKLVMARKTAKVVKVGALTITLIAPFEADVAKLREEWNEWLDKNKKAVQGIKDKMKGDAPFLGTAAANEFGSLLALSAFGNRKGITTPNLASIMFLIEEGTRTLLMTGDGFSGDVLKGLASVKKLNGNGGLHVDVLKIPHHGAIANIDAEFCKSISANHYIFCGNGAHTNPELEVIELVVNSRIGSDSNLSINGKNAKPFTLWFNSNEADTTESNKAHMRKVLKLVKSFKSTKVKFKFMPEGKSFMDLTV
jgi:hypothetical protein